MSCIQKMFHTNLLNWFENNGTGKQNFLTCAHQRCIYRKLVWPNDEKKNWFDQIFISLLSYGCIELIWFSAFHIFMWRDLNPVKEAPFQLFIYPLTILQMLPPLDCEVPEIREGNYSCCSPNASNKVKLSNKCLLKNK